MAERRKWAVGSNQYIKRPGAPAPSSTRKTQATSFPVGTINDGQREACAISWDRSVLDFSRIPQTSVERSRHRFRSSLPALIWNAAALEGNTFTLPEVQTLLDGVTVGGKPTEDAKQILALSEAYSYVDELVGADTFSLRKEVSDAVHKLLAVHEAIESGHFRGEGHVSGGGNVRLANGGMVPGFPAGEHGELLVERFDRMVSHCEALDDPRERALAYFASATRQQFYFDGNKRTARLMLSGELMRNGFEVVSVPFARRFEFNTSLDHLFTHDDATPLMVFLLTCVDG